MEQSRDRVIPLHASFAGTASVVGYKERQGPLGTYFDFYDSRENDGDLFGQKTFEQAENEMQRRALSLALERSGRKTEEVDALFAGDLLNQCTGSAYGLLPFDIPYFGLYGACSTAAEGILLAGSFVSNGICQCAAAVTSSHNSTAERQYRTPLAYGGQRTPTAQWTVTGAGAFVLTEETAGKPRLVAGLPGIVRDGGVKDTCNMGAAMAPAAADTFLRYCALTGGEWEEADMVLTGDLGYEGGEIFCDLLRTEGIELGVRYRDCGELIYTRQTQDTHAGGSGCGCSASVVASYILPGLTGQNWRRVLFLGTGAMMSPDTVKQGKSIPAIAHLCVLEAPEKWQV